MLEAADEPRSFLRGDYVLRNSLGGEVYSSKQGHAGDPGEPQGRAEAASLRRSTRIVPAGTYEIEAKSEGFRTVHEAVTVVAGKGRNEADPARAGEALT